MKLSRRYLRSLITEVMEQAEAEEEMMDDEAPPEDEEESDDMMAPDDEFLGADMGMDPKEDDDDMGMGMGMDMGMETDGEEEAEFPPEGLISSEPEPPAAPGIDGAAPTSGQAEEALMTIWDYITDTIDENNLGPIDEEDFWNSHQAFHDLREHLMAIIKMARS